MERPIRIQRPGLPAQIARKFVVKDFVLGLKLIELKERQGEGGKGERERQQTQKYNLIIFLLAPTKTQV